ncbi:cobalamin-binding protein [Candidatus Nanohalovita haloferacivicina]|uniref:cobalamin-binding protein n=1 Tax=Candidatus Nanohalovita haloferacivicina TaxID=2978046 RepID=UPI00325F95B2|nr:Iron complex transport system substrate-binding protein [Candidatus Nanohalobia archaeon BNXNv]
MRIVSLAPSNTEILYELGLGEDVVATTSLCDYPEEAAEKPSIGGWINPDIEKIRDFEPDFVVASDDLQDEAVEKMENEDFKVLQVRPHTLEEVKKSIREIGKALESRQEAEKVLENFEKRLEGLDFDGSPRIYCEEWMDPPMVSGNWIPGLIEKAGGTYFIEEGERSREFDLEKLKAFDPEYIFLNVCGAGENVDASEVLERPEWQDITAVEEGNVFVIDDSLLNRPSTRIMEGLEEIIENVDG